MIILLKDKNNNWVDFSDRFMRLSSITHNAEELTTKTIFVTSINNLVMDNTDGFWDDVSNFEDNFSLSKNKSEVVLKGTDVLIKDKINDKGKFYDVSLGRYKIVRLKTTEGKATIKLNSLSQWLNRDSTMAEKVKNGHRWHQFRSIPFLLEELLKLNNSADDIKGTVSSVTSPNLTLDVNRLPNWVKGEKIIDSNDSKVYSITKRVDFNTVEVSSMEDNSFDWSSGHKFIIKGNDSLPDSYEIPDRLLIPSYGDRREFSALGKTPTDVRENNYSRE